MLYVFSLPKVNANSAFVRGAANGWQISGITTIQSGANVYAQNLQLNYAQDGTGSAPNITSQNDQIGVLGTNDVPLYATIVCNPNMHKNVKQADGTPAVQFFNPACFQPAIHGQNGTTNLPYLAGPIYWGTDLTLSKNFRITERQGLQFRIAAFNFLNHPLTSFSSGDPNLKLQFDGNGVLKNNSTFGIADYKYGHRVIELGVKYSF